MRSCCSSSAWRGGPSACSGSDKQTLHTANTADQGDNYKDMARSIRAGGAMALKLAGHDVHTIRKMGRWSSDPFLMCAHEQIAALSTDLASTMSNHIPFHNIAGPTLLGADPFE